MARSSSYNTRTRQLILDYLQANPSRTLSAADIVAHLEAAGAPANPTTVYRYLDKLAAEQRVMKYVAKKGERAVYQYIDDAHHCHEHIHLKCTRCGQIFHMDCHFMDEVRQHLQQEHGFTLQCEGSILYGLCRDCAEKERQYIQDLEKEIHEVRAKIASGEQPVFDSVDAMFEALEKDNK